MSTSEIDFAVMGASVASWAVVGGCLQRSTGIGTWSLPSCSLVAVAAEGLQVMGG
jgi:hypothetical protein